MNKYKPTIGLEIHAELKTLTKMFCDSKNDPDEKKPNVNICPVCMAHPGTLPVINKEAVRHVLKVGIAVGGKLADFTEFDRKNYFYPDLPKGYQISQYKYPLVSGGEIANIILERIHLEEDTGRSVHDAGDYSLIDFNRAGVPLMELVTKPTIETAEQAVFFAKEFQLLLRYLGVSEANMEKGQMRVEANISVAESGMGTKVEVKNINSFKSVGRAITYEIKRQSGLLDKGEKVVQETRGWDENNVKTFSQRLKEESHDYRYFPDPDLPKLKISEIPEFSEKKLQAELPELPWQKRKRYKKEFGLKDEDVESYVSDKALADFFEQAVRVLGGDKEKIKLLSNYITSDLLGLMGQSRNFGTVSASSVAKLIEMVVEGKISSRGAKGTLELMYRYNEKGDPEKIAEEKGFLQKSDTGELEEIVQKIISDNPQVVADFKNGKEKSLQFLIGQGMRETGGAANPQILEKLFRKSLTND